jgi:hypothetical protein
MRNTLRVATTISTRNFFTNFFKSKKSINMKKSTLGLLLLVTIMTASISGLKAQWLTTGNALGGAGLLGSTNNNSYSLISNNTQRLRIMANGNIQIGANNVLNNTPSNYAQFDDDGDLKFFGTGSYLVPSNSYAFRWEGDEDIGLFFSATNGRYEFRDNTASPVFHVSSSGDVHADGMMSLDGDLEINFDGSILMGTLGTTDAKLNIHEGPDASLGAGGIVVLGAEAGVNLAMDINEIMARNNGGTATLFMQNEGGDTWFGGNNNSTIDLVIEDEGQVGIRTTAPSRELEVVHGSGSGATFGLMIANEEANDQDWTLYTNNSDGDLSFYQNGLLAAEISDLDGVYSPSDARLKANVKNMEPLMSRIMKLEPKTFTYIKSEHPDKTHIGFIAQEMEKQFPEIVGRAGEEQDTYVMNYSLLGVLSIKAIQEQQQLIEEQSSTIDKQSLEISELKDQIASIQAVLEKAGMTGTSAKSSANEKENMLYQNQPNPFSDKTTIKVQLKADAKDAFIIISSLQGETLQTIPVFGEGDVEINAGILPSGSYIYSLSVNGKVIDTKRMVVLN